MEDYGLTSQLRHWIAYTSVGPSTVRGQRSPGLVTKLRQLLTEIDRDEFSDCEVSDFNDLLNLRTASMQRRMPIGVRHWGTERSTV